MAADTPPEEEGLTDEQLAEIMRRLGSAFLQAADPPERPQQTIYIVYGVVGDRPNISTVQNEQALCDAIMEARVAQNADPENERYMHIFVGQQWPIQKGRVWYVCAGERMIPVTSENIDMRVDQTGSLREPIDFDTVVPSPPDEPETEDDEPDGDVEVVPGPPESG